MEFSHETEENSMISEKINAKSDSTQRLSYTRLDDDVPLDKLEHELELDEQARDEAQRDADNAPRDYRNYGRTRKWTFIDLRKGTPIETVSERENRETALAIPTTTELRLR